MKTKEKKQIMEITQKKREEENRRDTNGKEKNKRNKRKIPSYVSPLNHTPHWEFMRGKSLVTCKIILSNQKTPAIPKPNNPVD